MKHILSCRKPLLFPNNEIFFITAEIRESILHINIPDFYKAEMTNVLRDVDLSILEKSAMQDKIISDISALLNISKDTITFKASIDYQFVKKELPVPKNNGALYNQKDDLNVFLQNVATDSPIHAIYKKFPHCTAIIKDRTIVSFACTDNGSLSVETHPDFLGKGFATDCVVRLVHELLHNNAYNEIHFPTTFENLAARKVAKKVGFEEQNRGFWLLINTDLSLFDKRFLENGVERVQNPDINV